MRWYPLWASRKNLSGGTCSSTRSTTLSTCMKSKPLIRCFILMVLGWTVANCIHKIVSGFLHKTVSKKQENVLGWIWCLKYLHYSPVILKSFWWKYYVFKISQQNPVGVLWVKGEETRKQPNYSCVHSPFPSCFTFCRCFCYTLP